MFHFHLLFPLVLHVRTCHRVNEKYAVGHLKVTTKVFCVRMKVHGPYSPSLSLFRTNMKGGVGGKMESFLQHLDDELVIVNILHPNSLKAC